MIRIDRAGGDARDGYLYDAWFIRPATPLRADGWYQAGRLRMHPFEPHERRWTFEGDVLREGTLICWVFDGRVVRQPCRFRHQSDWYFDGTVLRPREDPALDEWHAGAPVPLPVIMLAAGLL